MMPSPDLLQHFKGVPALDLAAGDLFPSTIQGGFFLISEVVRQFLRWRRGWIEGFFEAVKEVEALFGGEGERLFENGFGGGAHDGDCRSVGGSLQRFG